MNHQVGHWWITLDYGYIWIACGKCAVGGIPDDGRIPKIWRTDGFSIWRFPKMGVPPARWMVYFMENPTIAWMITRGTHIFGNHHLWWTFHLWPEESLSSTMDRITAGKCAVSRAHEKYEFHDIKWYQSKDINWNSELGAGHTNSGRLSQQHAARLAAGKNCREW